MLKIKYIIIGIIAVVVISGVLSIIFIDASSPQIQSNKIQVVTSFYPLYYFSQQIAGDKADVINITPAGAEPHDYEPTAQDIVKIENSKLLILNGGILETWGNDVKKNINHKNTTIIVAGQDLMNHQTVSEKGQKVADPHVWLSPVLASRMVDKIADGFIEVDPENKDYYQANTDLLKTKLDDLDVQYEQDLSNCAEKNVITSHAAFDYLATAYGFNQVPITGLSPDAEPSSKQLADIVEFVKDNNVKYIFFESLVSPKLANTIASEVGAQTLVLNPIEGLTKEEILQGKNYFTEMQNNLANLKIALDCK
jgi:zinc transport system substrate-binding protein